MKVTKNTIDSLHGLLEERLEIDIIALLADRLGISVQEALELYYSSDLARQISEGSYGIQYLDASVLAADLLDNEKELVAAMLR